MNRLGFLSRTVMGVAPAMLLSSAVARADDYPSRPITMVVPWGPGGGSDQMGRAVAKVLQDTLKATSVPVINVPGADGNSGMVKMLTSDADGYTMTVFVADTFVGNMTSKTTAPWQMKDIVPLAIMNRQPFAYYVNADSPYKTWADVEKAAKTKDIKVAVDGFGSAEDVATKYFASRGLKLVGVPFPKPGERYAAVLGNQVDVMCDPNGNVRRYVESGQIRPVVVFSAKRVPQIPNTPTATELGAKVVLDEWRSIVVKAGTDPAKIAFLSDALARVYKSSDFQDFLKQTWSDPDSYVAGKDVPAYFSAREQEMKTLLAAIH
ncbi:MAG: tripartite tricarboxylate transporter substrate binding protein [Vulcanimicrobiaceae bacterium]|jgi:tripartite-type tricarboxylate transporter receptor subunit TctC